MGRSLAMLLSVFTLSLCGSVPASAQEHRAERSLDIKIVKRKVDEALSTIRAKQGEEIRLRWRTDETATVHLHGYDIEKTLKPGEAVEMTFKAHATGRFPIEAHGFGGKKGKHVTLLYLEVLPR